MLEIDGGVNNIRDHPDSHNVYNRLSKANIKHGAIKYYKHTLEKTPENNSARDLLTKPYKKL